jgi:hypothetical protein
MYRRQARVYCEGNGIETYRRSALHVHGVRAAGQDDHVGHQPLHSLLRPPCAHPTTHSQSPASPPARRSSLASRHVRRRWVLRVWSDSGGSGQMESDSVRNCTGPTRVCRRQHSRIASTCQTLARRPLQRRSDEGRDAASGRDGTSSASPGSSAEYTPSSRIRRVMSCVYCEPKSSTSTPPVRPAAGVTLAFLAAGADASAMVNWRLARERARRQNQQKTVNGTRHERGSSCDVHAPSSVPTQCAHSSLACAVKR